MFEKSAIVRLLNEKPVFAKLSKKDRENFAYFYEKYKDFSELDPSDKNLYKQLKIGAQELDVLNVLVLDQMGRIKK